MKIVRCPNCGLVLKTKGKEYFRCYRCSTAFDIEKCLMKDLEGKRWRRKDKGVELRKREEKDNELLVITDD